MGFESGNAKAMSEPTVIRADAIAVTVQEGMSLTLVKDPKWTPFMAFAQAWVSSSLLQGKPVCLKGILPGIALHISTRLEMHLGLKSYITAVWPNVLQQINAWQRIGSNEPCLALTVPYSQALIARCGYEMPEAALTIEWEHLPSEKMAY
jgi:hypothetical protein